MKVFQMNDCDWFMANSEAEAISVYSKEYGPFSSDELETRELDDSELNSMDFYDDFSDPEPSRTFAEELMRRVANGKTKPELFASTEY